MVPCDVQEQCLVLPSVFAVFIAEPHRLREYLLLRWSPDDISATASKNVKQSTKSGMCLGIYVCTYIVQMLNIGNILLLPFLNVPKFFFSRTNEEYLATA